MSIEPWNTGTGGAAGCEDMPRKSIDIRLTDHPLAAEKGQVHPFPAFRRGRVRAEPEIRSRDWSLAGSQGSALALGELFDVNICNFQGSVEPIFLGSFFHRSLDTTFSRLDGSKS